MDLIRQDKDKAIALGRANGLRGDAAMERKALDYYVQDLDIGLNKNNVEALLRLLDISDPAEKFFDDTYLKRAVPRQ
jgi:hypothetical protein